MKHSIKALYNILCLFLILIITITTTYSQTVKVVFADDALRTKRVCWNQATSIDVSIRIEFGECSNRSYVIDWGDASPIEEISYKGQSSVILPHKYNISVLNTPATGLADFEIRVTNKDDVCNENNRDYDNANLQVHKQVVPDFNITAACVGRASTFSNTSVGRTNRKGALEWTWEFSNGNKYTTENPPAQTFTSTENQFVTLSVKQPIGGCNVSPAPKTKTINLDVAPEAIASIFDESSQIEVDKLVCISNETDGVLVLDGGNSQRATGYSWSITPANAFKVVEGTTTQEKLKVQLTQLDRDYTISFTARNACPANPITRTFTTRKTPDISLVKQSDGCEELIYTISNPISEAVYTLDGEVIANPAVPIPLTTREAPYVVTAKLENQCGVKEDRMEFSVYSKDPVNITSTIAPMICKGEARIPLKADLEGGRWLGAGVESIEGNWYFNPSNEGDFTVSYERGEGVCLSKDSRLVQVINSLPTASIGLDGTGVVCSGSTVTFSNLSTNTDPTFAKWTFGDGTSPIENAEPTVQHLFQSEEKETPFTITLEVKNVCGVDKASRIVRVAPNAISPLFEFDKERACVGTVVNFKDNTPAAIGWEWSFGDGVISTNQNPTHTFKEVGEYTVLLKARNSCTTGEKSQLIIVEKGPDAKFDMSAALVCADEEVMFINHSASNMEYRWNFGDGTEINAVDFSPTHRFDNPGKYDITLFVYNGEEACGTEVKKQIIVQEPFEAHFTAEFDPSACGPALVKLVNQTPHANEWSWDLGNNEVTSVQNPTIKYSNGQYLIQLTASKDGACKTTYSEAFDFAFSDCQVQVPEAFTPNGDKIGDGFTIFGASISQIKYLRVRNRWGEVVFEMKGVPAGSQVPGEMWDGTKNGNPLPAEMYVYETQLLFKDQSESEVMKGSFYLVR